MQKGRRTVCVGYRRFYLGHSWEASCSAVSGQGLRWWKMCIRDRSTRAPREVLIRKAVGFIMDREIGRAHV